ncbi:hypothetical protein [Brachyspira pilosicoli]|uniref:hypothetical protein n=1 Tax=Brachyspira pilosicoli TaxID=52584 RepID=UPI000CA90A0B|nr:hypothetical protein [Brachyspira pilosicoli]PLV64479.1 hypothetical protein BPSP16_00915 [Brachyspira pilosicoli SP16]
MTSITIMSCNSKTTNPTDIGDVSLRESLTSSGKLSIYEDTEKNSLIMKEENSSNNGYVSASKTSDNQYTVLISDDKNSKVTTIYNNNSLFPDKISINNGTSILNGDILNYNETENTFDISWREDDGTEIFYFSGIKLKGKVDSKFSSNDEETYELKIMLTSSLITDSMNDYINENPMPRAWWNIFLKVIAVVAIITVGVLTGGTGVIAIPFL